MTPKPHSLAIEMTYDNEDAWILVEKPPKSVSWNAISSSSLFPHEIGRMIEEIISQPDAKPWEDVATLSPSLQQVIMDDLQAGLDRSRTMESGFAREAAIKCLQAINRVSDILPNGLALENVQMESNHPVACGGFSDIYLGRYRSQKVCLKAPRIFPSDRQSRKLAKLLEIIEGIHYLHTHRPPIVHADIRGANILVRDNFTCCLADFGLTMAIETRYPTHSRLGKGTSYWMSPEVWTQTNALIPARDIYSFGCTVIEIYSGKHPFPDITNPTQILQEVVVNKRKPPRPTELREAALWAIVESCLEFHAERRPTIHIVYTRLQSFVSSVR